MHGTIVVTSADKGGSVIIVTPELIHEITLTKVSDPLKYQPLSTDPTQTLQSKLLDLWGKVIEERYVSPEQSRVVVGIIENADTGALILSTSDLVKLDTPYGHPLLKVHKLSQAELPQKKIPPSRFVTDLSREVAARSDKFFVWKWLGPLVRDYCMDLVKDSTAALMKLEALATAGYSIPI